MLSRTNYLELFLSLIIVVRDQASEINSILSDIYNIIDKEVTDYELIIIDNGSSDNAVDALQKLTLREDFPNLRVIVLSQEVDLDVAFTVGCEHSIGDYVAVMDPIADDPRFLPKMLKASLNGADIVLAKNIVQPKNSFSYSLGLNVFKFLYKKLNKIDFNGESSTFKIFSRSVINYILKHPQPSIIYKHLTLSRGFKRVILHYKSNQSYRRHKKFRNSIYQGIKLLVSTTQAPMRLVTAMSLFGAVANLIYSFYILCIWFFKTDIEPGWVSLSLQQSGMFLLLSLVLLVLGEYILHMATLSNEGPRYHIAQEFVNQRITGKERLNIEEGKSHNSEDLR